MLKNCLRLGLVLSLALVTASVEAQITTGGIRGIVTDESAGVLIGVTVSASSPSRIGEPAVTITNNMGLYQFEGFPPGVYTVTFELSGFGTLNRENVRVEVGRSTQLDIVLGLAGQSETVTVTAESPVIDTVHADYSTNFSQELVKNIPTTRLSYFDIVTAVPGVKANHATNVSRFSIYGSGTEQNSFQMDGVDVSGPSYGGPWDYPNYDIIQEVEVLGVGASAEFSGFMGGAVNIVTKSGSNNWRGVASAFFQSDALTGNNTPDEEYPMTVDYGSDITFQLGGPIIKDKLWVIGLLQDDRFRGVPVGVELIDDVQSGHEVRTFFKLNAQFGANDNLEFSFDDNIFDSPNEPSREQPIEATNHEHGHNPVVSVRYTHLFGANTILEAKGGGIYIRDREDSMFDNFDDPGRFDWGTGFSSVNSQGSWRSHQNKTQVAAAITHYADDFIKGSHDFKFGAQLLRSKDIGYWTYFGPNYAFYYDYYGYNYYVVTHAPSAYGATMDSDSFYVNDNWTLSDRVSLNLGVRFDHATGGLAEAEQLDYRLENPTGVTFPGQSGLIKFNNWSPRVGLTVRLDESGKTVAKANYGRFYGKILGNWIKRLGEGNLPTVALLYSEDSGEYDEPFWFWSPNVNMAIDPNLSNQYTDQMFVGFEREVMPNLGVDVSFIYKTESNQVRAEDFGGTYNEIPFVDTWEGQTQTLSVYDRISGSASSLFTLTNRPEFDHSYKSLVIQANKRWSQGWTLNSSYQWQDGKGYTAGGIGLSAQTFSSFSPNMFGADPNSLINAYGRLPTDNTHTLKINTGFDVPGGLVVGVRYIFETGRPYARLINVTGLGQGVKEVQAAERGTYLLESVHDLMVRANKDFELGPNKRLRLSIDVFNLLNRANAIDLRNNSTQAGENFGESLEVPAPRRAMIGVRFEF